MKKCHYSLLVSGPYGGDGFAVSVPVASLLKG